MQVLTEQALPRVLVMALAAWLAVMAPPDARGNALGLPALKEVPNTADYFPDGIGSVWGYMGRTHTDTIERIAEVTFRNDVTAIGTTNIKGETVKIFRETNQGNRGPTDGYFRVDRLGITYYGSKPTTPFEEELVPYRVLKFPLFVGGRYQQLNRANVDMHADMDRDGESERADVLAHARVIGYEPITVAAGAFPEALRIEAVMTIAVTLSKTRQVAVTTDRLTSWFARGVGLIKYEEIIETLPLLETRAEITHLTEELERYSVKEKTDLRPVPELPPLSPF